MGAEGSFFSHSFILIVKIYPHQKPLKGKKIGMRVFFSLIGRNTSSLYISIKADSLEEKAVVGGAIKKPWVFFTKLKVLILPLILMIEYDKLQKKLSLLFN